MRYGNFQNGLEGCTDEELNRFERIIIKGEAVLRRLRLRHPRGYTCPAFRYGYVHYHPRVERSRKFGNISEKVLNF